MRGFIAGALAVVGCVTVAALVTGGTGAAAAPTGCRVGYTVTARWAGGLRARVTVRNDGPPVTAWVLGFDLPTGQRVDHAWNATLTQRGGHVTATHPRRQPGLATGAAVTFGFAATGSAPGTATGFRLNGTACTTEVPSPAVTPSPTAPVVAPATTIQVTGVVRTGVEPGCLLLVPDVGQPYPEPFLLIEGDRTVLVAGAHVRVDGEPMDVATTCQQGHPLRVTGATVVP